jgi:hypothetical protein
MIWWGSSSRKSIPKIASIRAVDQGMFEMKTPWDEDFLAVFKLEVPSKYRTWDKDEKVWYVDGKYLDTVIALLERYFDEVRIPSSDNGGSPYRTLCLTEKAPMELVKAAHRILAKMHHPDHGGDPEEFLKIQQAYERICGGKK